MIAGASAESVNIRVFIEGLNQTFDGTGAASFGDINLKFLEASIGDYPKMVFDSSARGNSLNVIVDGKVFGNTDFKFIQTSADSLDKNTTIKSIYLDSSNPINNIKILYRGQEKLSVDVADLLCNNNGKCENCQDGKCTNHFENYLSCPKDCMSNAADGICNPAKDGKCDKDCLNNEDSDCAILATKSSTMLIIYIAIFFIVIMIAATIFLILKNIIDSRKVNSIKTETSNVSVNTNAVV